MDTNILKELNAIKEEFGIFDIEEDYYCNSCDGCD